MKRVYVLIVNWNGWGDTIECLESVFRLDYPDFRVIVCDNASDNGSIEKIKAWCEGCLDVSVPKKQLLRELSFPPVAKPVRYVFYTRDQTENCDINTDSSRLTLIQTGENLGFAGGNNIGLRYIQSRGDFDYVWLLNNDTVVKPDALTWMVKRMEDRPDAGMCGSLLPFYYRPDRIWAQGGGFYNAWLAKPVACVGLDLFVADKLSVDQVETQMDYLAGASMLVSVHFLKSVGLMNEKYFLYFEEIDWAMRARKKFQICYEEMSVVYHKVASSVRNYDSKAPITRNSKAIYYKNEVFFACKYFPVSVPLVILRLVYCVAVIAATKIRGRIKHSGGQDEI